MSHALWGWESDLGTPSTRQGPGQGQDEQEPVVGAPEKAVSKGRKTREQKKDNMLGSRYVATATARGPIAEGVMTLTRYLNAERLTKPHWRISRR